MSLDKDKESPAVLEHEEALKVYIDALLLEPAPETVAEPEPQVEAPVKPVEEKVEQQVETPVVTEAVEEAPASIGQPERQQAALEESDQVFECLLFKVAGFLTLAVPLVRLNGILQWNGELTPIPGHADWFLGLVTNRGKQVKVIDIAKFVIPENHKSRQAVEGERHFKHLLLIDDGKLGLAVDDLGKVLKLTRDKVRWREDRSTRPWLAGTIIEQMSALIDVERFTKMLKEGVPLDVIS
jgi:purine-binding chemotaxis protein CheW